MCLLASSGRMNGWISEWLNDGKFWLLLLWLFDWLNWVYDFFIWWIASLMKWRRILSFIHYVVNSGYSKSLHLYICIFSYLFAGITLRKLHVYTGSFSYLFAGIEETPCVHWELLIPVYWDWGNSICTLGASHTCLLGLRKLHLYTGGFSYLFAGIE